MCGIYGTIKIQRRSESIDTGALRALTMANRDRGKQALGFFDSNGNKLKKADDPQDVLQTTECTEFLDNTEFNSWFVVGHTRYGTQGANTDNNSHPFEYGGVIGSHNGIVDSPSNYEVDSEYAIDLLDQHKSDYQKALADVWGYWTLAWFDKRYNELFLTMYDNTCGLVKCGGAWYFSSDPDHLAVAIGLRDTIVLKDGDTVSFDSKGRMKWRKKFSSNMAMSYKKDYRTSGGYASSAGGSYTTSTVTRGWTPSSNGYIGRDPITVHDPEHYVRDYDKEFRDCWEEYAHQYDDI